ncbi:MAG TPA: glycosyltransferase N-terminal domain-containing protein [Bacteroidales bacterium]|nr:glycosyltransferase N-terminal domain-containing protein [Bacteroidales bacterium]HPF02914.1 glycosyltransferase N-terminal domain-containing protein [Bacteroidales bacterium]HPJ59184.1 glycosyltransferase N-terminal domain-containing protein [Bacteroidales bacterium]HPR11807.1 glycosyltransferase N-terminal domain-containing protein [Bacteroidales bacterium]HRW84044.1 glycosyltransferase N-terminal domain-containing protein [Bacteroidales bacterium]
MHFLYNLGIFLYRFIATLVSPFNRKAALWVKGQKETFKVLQKNIVRGEKYFWFHCSSLGEFEQGRPVMEALGKEKPEYKILLTFFSPSGYEIRKKWPLADVVCYLPSDTPSGARRFIRMVRPEGAVFVKYEFWSNYISELNTQGIPLYLISAVFRPGQIFFRWYGGFFRAMLYKFRWIFVQDEESKNLLGRQGIVNVTVAGDTRFDRVLKIVSESKDIPVLEQFRGGEKLFLAGSSWKPDEEIIAGYINSNPAKMKWVFAPHEIDDENIRRLERLFTVRCTRFSRFGEGDKDARVLIIDNIGMLSSAYRYAFIAEVGGGFGKGIHNVLEPACWGIPVLFGPVHGKFREAVELIEAGGAAVFRNNDEFGSVIDRWLSDDNLYRKAAKTAGNYVVKNSGATARIINEFT